MEKEIDKRRNNFIETFTGGNPKYNVVKEKLKQAVFRLGVEQYKKSVSANAPMTQAQKNDFKSKLYIFLQKKLKDTLLDAIYPHRYDQQVQRPDDIHNDILS